MKKILYLLPLLIQNCLAQPESSKTVMVSCVPVPSVCNPVTLDSLAMSLGIGISFVGLNLIQNNSVPFSPTLEEFTCTDSTVLNIAQAYPFEVHTGLAYEESVTAWIDFSNDGDFDASEIVFHDSGKVYMHTGFVTIPAGAINTFTPIRMRVGSEYTGMPVVTGCDDLLYGHYEDYKIFYGQNIGVGENENRLHVELSPNPFNESATLAFGKNNLLLNGKLGLKIYDPFGRLISTAFHSNETAITIERKNMLNGIYFYELTAEDGRSATGKFITE